MSVLRHSLQRLGNRKLLIIAGLLTGIPWIAVVLASMLTIDSYLVPEVHSRTETVAHLIESDLDRALSLGIPLDKMVGVTAYLEEVMSQNQGIRFVTIVDTNKKIVFGATLEGEHRRLRSIMDKPPLIKLLNRYGSDVAVVSVVLGRPAPTFRPGAPPAENSGTLYVGADAGPPGLVYRELQFKLLIGLIAVFLCSYELLIYVAARQIAMPVAAADRMIDRIISGDMRHIEHVTDQGRPGHLLTTLNRIVRVLGDRVVDFRSYLDEVRDATRAVAAQRLDALGALIEDALLADPAGPKPFPVINHAPLHRLVVFLLAGATASIVPLLYVRLRGGTPTGIDLHHLMPLILFIAGLNMGGRLMRPLLVRLGHGFGMIVALAMIAFAVGAIAWPVRQIETMGMADLLLGSGIGYLLIIHLEKYILDTSHLGNPRAAVLTGAVAGFGVAEIIARFDADTSLYLPAFLLFLAAGAMALSSAQRVDWKGGVPAKGRRPSILSSLMPALVALSLPAPEQGRYKQASGLTLAEITAGFGRWRIALPAIGLTAPVQALAVLLLALDLPRRLAAPDAAIIGNNTAGLALALLTALIVLSAGNALAGGALHRSTILRQPLMILGRLVLALGVLMTTPAPGGPDPNMALAIAMSGFGLVAFGFGLCLAADRHLAFEAGQHDPEYGAPRAALFIELLGGMAVAAILIAASYLLPSQQFWLRAGISGLTILAWLVYTGLNRRHADHIVRETAL